MSRIAKNPIKFSQDVECNFSGGIFSAKGKLGKIEININNNFIIDIQENVITVIPSNLSKNDPNVIAHPGPWRR